MSDRNVICWWSTCFILNTWSRIIYKNIKLDKINIELIMTKLQNDYRQIVSKPDSIDILIIFPHLSDVSL